MHAMPPTDLRDVALLPPLSGGDGEPITLAAMTHRLQALLDRAAIQHSAPTSAPHAANNQLLVLSAHYRMSDSVVRQLHRFPALHQNIRRIPDGQSDRETVLWDIGAFTVAEFEAASAASDPLAFLAARTLGGEDALYELICRKHGVPFRPSFPFGAKLEGRPVHPRSTSVLGAARLTIHGEAVTLVAPPRNNIVKWLHEMTRHRPSADAATVVTTPRRMEMLLRASIASSTLEKTTGHLIAKWPLFSASTCPSLAQKLVVLAAVSFMIWGILDVDGLASLALFSAFAISFLVTGVMRYHATWSINTAAPPAPAVPDADLPSYTVLVALYREADLVAGLVEGLDRLDYPPDRREVKILLEADDAATIRAAELACRGRDGFTVVEVPSGTPRTKPRALAYGLAFARGDLITVYDAEDRPEPDQLRKAAAALLHGPDHLGCVQAALCIDGDRTFLQQQFAIEYASLFRALLPWLGRQRVPMPLGGTSNHFKRVALDEIGGWDPFNVTEDADLGVRLARFGYTSDVLDSVTWEEAPAETGVWIRQRTRWIKGWMVTWLVHMRRPAALYRQLGLRNFAVVQTHVVTSVIAPLVHPFGVALAILGSAGVRPIPAGNFVMDLLFVSAALGMAAGYLGNIWMAVRALQRSGRSDLIPLTLLMPLYWLLVSFAAWRAVAELIRKPHYWAKTPHVPAGTAVRSGPKRKLERVKGIEPSS